MSTYSSVKIYISYNNTEMKPLSDDMYDSVVVHRSFEDLVSKILDLGAEQSLNGDTPTYSMWYYDKQHKKTDLNSSTYNDFKTFNYTINVNFTHHTRAPMQRTHEEIDPHVIVSLLESFNKRLEVLEEIVHENMLKKIPEKKEGGWFRKR